MSHQESHSMWFLRWYTYLASALFAVALELDTANPESIKEATRRLIPGVLDYYGGGYGEPVGTFTAPYYWWESGLAWGALIDHWFFTQDDEQNALVSQALIAQAGEHWDYTPLNQSTTEGNDDQIFWALAAMAAAERGFPNPMPVESQPQWLALAQAVFNQQSARWDFEVGSQACGGGLRWQIFPWNTGYDYKNSVTNSGYFQLAARLGRYMGNATCVERCEEVWNWMEGVGLLIQGASENELVVLDGVHTTDNCSHTTDSHWSYNQGLLLAGTAYLVNYAENTGLWEGRFSKLLNGAAAFFQEGIMYEQSCQAKGNCNTDQRSFKAYLSRALGLCAQLVPGSRPTIDWYLEKSAAAAAESCSGGRDGITCGLDWTLGYWDGVYGLGEQLSALEVIQNLLYKERPGPYTQHTGGTSIGNPSAGMRQEPDDMEPLDLYAGDRVGAIFITLVIAGSIFLTMIEIVM